MCIGVAFFVALTPVAPLPRHVPVSAAVGPGPELPRPAFLISAPEFKAGQNGLTWSAVAVSAPFTVVLLNADYRELARVDGIGSTDWQVPERLVRRLVQGETYHAYVLGGEEDDIARSPLVSFVWR